MLLLQPQHKFFNGHSHSSSKYKNRRGCSILQRFGSAIYIAQRAARDSIAAGEGQISSIFSVGGFGLGTALGIESGPLSVGVGTVGYVSISILTSRAWDYANSNWIFPQIDNFGK